MSFLSASLQQRSGETVKVHQLDVAIPLQLKSQLKKGGGGQPCISEGDSDINDTMQFVMLTRKGNKQQVRVHLTDRNVSITCLLQLHPAVTVMQLDRVTAHEKLDLELCRQTKNLNFSRHQLLKRNDQYRPTLLICSQNQDLFRRFLFLFLLMHVSSRSSR